MKLSKMLFSSGVLASGRVRHYSEWDITSLAAKSRFGGSPALRLAANRRAGFLEAGRRRPSILDRFRFLRRIAGK